MNTLDRYTDYELQKILNKSCSIRDALKQIGLTTNGGSSYISLKRRIEASKLSTDKFKENYSNRLIKRKRKLSYKEIFCENSIATRQRVKQYIIDNNIIEYVCTDCGISDKWNGKSIVLQLDHINGINNDNRLQNLRFLCPNCHSQTHTYTSKRLKKDPVIYKCPKCDGVKASKTSNLCFDCNNTSRQKKFVVSRNLLERLIKVDKVPFTQLGKRFGVSDNAVRKRARKFGII
jgi:Zn finger protein HypA/HybF involved in hydrogenase expression